MGELEKEKYELQKSHTKNIQDLLDETNRRLEAMEDEYNTQGQTTVKFYELLFCQLNGFRIFGLLICMRNLVKNLNYYR